MNWTMLKKLWEAIVKEWKKKGIFVQPLANDDEYDEMDNQA